MEHNLYDCKTTNNVLITFSENYYRYQLIDDSIYIVSTVSWDFHGKQNV